MSKSQSQASALENPYPLALSSLAQNLKAVQNRIDDLKALREKIDPAGALFVGVSQGKHSVMLELNAGSDSTKYVIAGLIRSLSSRREELVALLSKQVQADSHTLNVIKETIGE